MPCESLLASHPWKFPNEVRRKNVAPVGNRGPIVTTKVGGDLRNVGATSTAVGWIGGQAVRPRVGNVDERIARKALLLLRLERVIVGSEEVNKEQARAVSSVRTQHVEPVGVPGGVNRTTNHYGAAACYCTSRGVCSRASKARRGRGAVQVGG